MEYSPLLAPDKNNPKMLSQFQYCDREQEPYLVIVGEDETRDEKAMGEVKVRNAISRKEVSLVTHSKYNV